MNLVTIAGDDPKDRGHHLRQPPLQPADRRHRKRPNDVLFTGGFGADGDWRKHNILKADRADGIYLRNMAFELARKLRLRPRDRRLHDGPRGRPVQRSVRDPHLHERPWADQGLRDPPQRRLRCVPGVGGRRERGKASASAQAMERRDRRLQHPPQRPRLLGHRQQPRLVPPTTRCTTTAPDTSPTPSSAAIRVYPRTTRGSQHNRIYANNSNYYVNTQGDTPVCGRARPADVGYQNAAPRRASSSPASPARVIW